MGVIDTLLAQIFHYVILDEQTVAKIGALVGQSADNIDVEFAVDPGRILQTAADADSGIFTVIPVNIFAALSSNDSVMAKPGRYFRAN